MGFDTRTKFKAAGIIFILCSLFLIPIRAQEAISCTTISGRVVDDDTGEGLPYVQIYFLQSTSDRGIVPSEVGTTTDSTGCFSIDNCKGFSALNFQMLGYKTEMMTLRKGQNRKGVKVKLTPDVYGLQDIVVTPKVGTRRYSRKNNPAVELIKHVIAHKDQHCVKTADQYTAQSYSRLSFALDNVNIPWEKPFWKPYDFIQKYIDTTGVYPKVTISIREQMNTEYFQKKPRREKSVPDKKRVFGVEDLLGPGSLKDNLNATFRDVEINDNNMNLLFNRFVSPLSSSLGIQLYQYFILDTLMVDGYSCIDLAFIPVYSQSFCFTGHLYIVNDSTYRIKKYSLNVPTNINLNFVSNFAVEHSYKQLENGLWAPDRTSTFAKFYIFNHKSGILARQTKLYTNWDLESPIAIQEAEEQRLGAEAWDTLRPEPLTQYEQSVYDLAQEVTANKTLANLIGLANAAGTEFIATTPANKLDSSKFDFGPIYQSISWNKLEGVRLRIGGASTANMHDHCFFRGYVAYGIDDKRPKYNGTFIYTFDKHRYQPYDRLRHHLQFSAQYDVEEPGMKADIVRRDHILMSIPTSKPTLGFAQYVFHAKAEYMKEWQNGFTIKTHFDFSNNEAAGVLRYDRVQWTENSDGSWSKTTTSIGSYRNYEGYVELRYSPGRRPYIDRMGMESPFALDKEQPTFRLMHYVGYLDDRHNGGDGFVYNRTEALYDQRIRFATFGYLDLRLQGGISWQKVPFTKLCLQGTSTSFLLAQRSFNLMKPMEFLMDQYISLYATYYFNGWILNHIPGINKLQLRGVVSVAAVYGGLTKKNNPFRQTGTGLYEIPQNGTYDDNGYWIAGRTSSPIGKLPYVEITAGFENIFKFFRIDYIRRITYNDYELPFMIQNSQGNMVQARRKIPGWGRNGVKLTMRFAL